MSRTIQDVDRFEMMRFVRQKLNAFKLERDENNYGWVGTCPYCGVNNGQFFVTEKDGQCHCRNCGVEKGLHEVFDHVISLIVFEAITGEVKLDFQQSMKDLNQ